MAGGDQASWADEGRDLARAASGGLLFGVPLLYTMEVWWLGSQTAPARMLLTLALLWVVLVGLNLTGGFRESRDVNLGDALQDAVEALAVGIATTTMVLVALRQIRIDTPLSAALGSIVSQCIPFCIGVGVARFLLQGDPGLDEDEDDLGGGSEAAVDEAPMRTSLADLVATALGAVFLGLAIAPTDEVPMLAAEMGPPWQALVVVITLVTSYVVVFVAGFAGQDRRREHSGIFDRPVTETLVTYVVALVVSALLLWVFQRGGGPPDAFLAQVVVLGLPTSVGGAVGRLAL